LPLIATLLNQSLLIDGQVDNRDSVIALAKSNPQLTTFALGIGTGADTVLAQKLASFGGDYELTGTGKVFEYLLI
jgi:hypothetical protein